MRLYISGPMTGLPDLNFPAFRAAQAELGALGHDTVNPVDKGEGDPDKAWADYLREDLVDMLTCQGVALLDGWENSKGACLERHVAAELGMDVRPIGAWINPTEARP